jgi:hypothetical protein
LSEKDTAEALFVLYAAFPNTEWSTVTQSVYVKYLADIPVEELQTVIAQAIGTCKFPPTVAEIRDTWHGLRTIGRLTYVEAWDMVQKEIRRIGSYSKPRFEDAITTQVVASMGWRELCMSETPEISRAQFRDMYNALLARGDNEQKLLPQSRALAEQRGGLIPMRNVLGALTDSSRNGSK